MSSRDDRADGTADPSTENTQSTDHQTDGQTHDTAPEATVTETPTTLDLTKHAPAPEPESATATATGTPTPTPHAPEAPPTPDVVVEEPVGPALGTIVWGCTALAVAALIGAWEVAEVRVDVGLAVPVAMVVLGLLLVVGAVVTAVRQRR